MKKECGAVDDALARAREEGRQEILDRLASKEDDAGMEIFLKMAVALSVVALALAVVNLFAKMFFG